jgi:SdrD B-like domain/LysM domain
MRIKLVLAIFLFISGVVVLSSQVPAAASPAAQVAYPSPTPGQDGRIIYIVKAGETCTQISLLYGVSIEYIRTSNLLDENCGLREGQRLLIGVGVAPGVTANAGAALTAAAQPTPTVTPGVGGTAQVCVLIYDDANGDALRQASEGAIAGAAINLTSEDGKYSQTLTSAINPDATVYQGMCFADVPAGKYSVSAAAPDGYNATINSTTSVDVIPGNSIYVDFGAQVKAAVDATTTTKGPSPVLGVVGAALLLGGVGLAAFTLRMLRKK